MKVCYTGGAVKDCGSYYSVATNAVELRIWFLTDDILRIRAGFDGDWDEASYSLTMTAWESRTDELMKDCRKRVQSAAAALTDGDRQAVIQGARLKVVIEKEVPDMFVVPKDAVVMRDGFHVLFRLEEGHAVWTYVDVVYSNISQYAVTGNARKETKIEDGDVVITSGNLNLADGTEVIPRERKEKKMD